MTIQEANQILLNKHSSFTRVIFSIFITAFLAMISLSFVIGNRIIDRYESVGAVSILAIQDSLVETQKKYITLENEYLKLENEIALGKHLYIAKKPFRNGTSLTQYCKIVLAQ